VEGPLSPKLLIWLASVNVVAPAIRLLGCVLSKNRRIWLVVPWIASFFASIGLFVVVCLMQIDGISYLCFYIAQADCIDNEKYQKAFLGLLSGNYGVLVVCEVLS
jgi:hypothetical protein